MDRVIFGILFSAFISSLSYFFKLLTPGGSKVQFILGCAIFCFGGWPWAVPIVTFFISSTLISGIGSGKRKEAETFYEKTSSRDAWQVLANGGVSGVLVLCWALFGGDCWYGAYVGSIAAATADTWGTEIGTLLPLQPRLITTLERVAKGTSGAVSPPGFVAGVAGALLIGLSTRLWYGAGLGTPAILAATAGGLVGSLADSFLGASVQVQNRCMVCQKILEKAEHCGQPTSYDHGIKWFKNDAVNLACTTIGSIVTAIFLKLWN